MQRKIKISQEIREKTYLPIHGLLGKVADMKREKQEIIERVRGLKETDDDYGHIPMCLGCYGCKNEAIDEVLKILEGK